METENDFDQERLDRLKKELESRKESVPKRVRLEWTDDTRSQVKAVDDPNGPFLFDTEYVGCLNYRPKTQHEKLVEAADAGEIPTVSDPEVEAPFSQWSRGYRVHGGGFCMGGEYYPPSRDIQIVDYWKTEDGNHSCPKRIVIDGVLYNIPQPPEPPKDEDAIEWRTTLPLGCFTVWSPANPPIQQWARQTKTGLWSYHNPKYGFSFRMWWIRFKAWFNRNS